MSGNDDNPAVRGAFEAERSQEWVDRLRERVLSLVRYGIKKAGDPFRTRATAPDDALVKRTIERLREDNYAGPLDTGPVRDALVAAVQFLKRPPPWPLVLKRPCPKCSAGPNARCRENGHLLVDNESHYERIVVACRDLCQPPPTLSRGQTRRFACPKCGAAAGLACDRGTRAMNHQERHKLSRREVVAMIAGTTAPTPPGMAAALSADPATARLSAISAVTGQPVLGAPYETGSQSCFKCKKPTLVYTWAGWHEWTTDPPPHPAAPTIREVFSQEAGHRYWANTCGNCRVLQGDFYMYNTSEGAFYQRGTVDFTDPDVIAQYQTTESPTARMMREAAMRMNRRR